MQAVLGEEGNWMQRQMIGMESDTKLGMDRLENWARWACGGEIAIIMSHYYRGRAAVCGEYSRRSDDGDDEEAAPEVPIPIDAKDAILVESAIRSLPAHLFKAVRFWFVGRPRIEGVPRRVIRGWVEQAAREISMVRV